MIKMQWLPLILSGKTTGNALIYIYIWRIYLFIKWHLFIYCIISSISFWTVRKPNCEITIMNHIKPWVQWIITSLLSTCCKDDIKTLRAVKAYPFCMHFHRISTQNWQQHYSLYHNYLVSLWKFWDCKKRDDTVMYVDEIKLFFDLQWTYSYEIRHFKSSLTGSFLIFN